MMPDIIISSSCSRNVSMGGQDSTEMTLHSRSLCALARNAFDRGPRKYYLKNSHGIAPGHQSRVNVSNACRTSRNDSSLKVFDWFCKTPQTRPISRSSTLLQKRLKVGCDF